MTDRVDVTNLCLHGHHGVFPEEKTLGQKFYVDIECHMDVRPAAKDDDYAKAVSYADLCDIAVGISGQGPYNLVETLGDRIAQAILDRFHQVTKVVIRLRKPAAPMAVHFDSVGVTITRQRRYRIGLSLGSNLGDKLANLRRALAWLNTDNAIEIDRVSKFYRTAPWGKEDQDWFLNACATGWSTLDPVTILKVLKRVELHLGRVPGERWGPRAIDIDLLFVDDMRLKSPLLTLPHPEMFNRSFVLVPLAEIAADYHLAGARIGDAASALDYDADAIMAIDA
jgi:dihydroneopterin aldolase/2-amino-4-hydroxy-6-hydroxymethyldihydropteridine diphosphokinase